MNKIYCKKDYLREYVNGPDAIKFYKGQFYTYEEYEGKIRIYFNNDTWYQFHGNDHWKYFCTKQELRKLKLNEIDDNLH